MSNKECPKKEENYNYCICSNDGCSRKGVCCECVKFHKENGGTPACFR